jgi:hypothetical protein
MLSLSTMHAKTTVKNFMCENVVGQFCQERRDLPLRRNITEEFEGIIEIQCIFEFGIAAYIFVKNASRIGLSSMWSRLNIA